MRSSLKELKSHINKKNLLLLEKAEASSLYFIEKLFAWQENYSDKVKWDEFKDCWFYCEYCNHYSDTQCICYAR